MAKNGMYSLSVVIVGVVVVGVVTVTKEEEESTASVNRVFP